MSEKKTPALSISDTPPPTQVFFPDVCADLKRKNPVEKNFKNFTPRLAHP